jgi:hypothetical protein
MELGDEAADHADPQRVDRLPSAIVALAPESLHHCRLSTAEPGLRRLQQPTRFGSQDVRVNSAGAKLPVAVPNLPKARSLTPAVAAMLPRICCHSRSAGPLARIGADSGRVMLANSLAELLVMCPAPCSPLA